MIDRNGNSIGSTSFLGALLRQTIAVVLAASMPLSAWAAASVPVAVPQSADALLIKNQFRAAEEAYRAMLAEDQTGDAYAGLAVSLAKQATPAKVAEAEKVLKQARDKFPENPNVIAAGGYVSFVHSKSVASSARREIYLEAAEKLSERAIEASPDILIAYQTLGLVKIAQDDSEGAIEPFRKAVQLAENAVNLTLLAQALLRNKPKETEEPERLIKKALSLKGDYSTARLQKALILGAQNKPEDAYSELHNIPDVERTAEWYAAEGDIYKRQGDGPAALASWHESIRKDPHNPEPYRHMAEYYSLRGDGELAIGEMHNALEILPNDMQLRSELAELALRQDKLDVAEAEYKTILAATPDDANALVGLTRVGYRRARRDGAYPAGWKELLDQLNNVRTQQSVSGVVVKNDSGHFEDKVQLSEAEKALSAFKFREAHEKFTSVINKYREDAYELLTLGEQAFLDGDFKSAEQAYTYAKEIPEVQGRAEQGLSKIISQRNEAARQVKLGDATWKMSDVALDHYNQALIADPQHADAFYGLYSVYARAEPEKAITNANCFLEAAEESDPRRREVEGNVPKLAKRVGPNVKGK